MVRNLLFNWYDHRTTSGESNLMWRKLGLGLAILFGIHCAVAEPAPPAGKLLQAALRYERGAGVERDYHKAFRLYCIAAAMKNRRAMYQLGWLYFNGRGIERDRSIAMGWFHRAAKKGDRYAMRMVKKFNRVPPRRDPRCPIVHDPGKMRRGQIAAWAHLLGTELGVDPKLVMAVIETESNFDPLARSPKLAYGLMQLMPATARRFSVDRLHPVENMIGGVLYLRWLLRHFHGNVGLALAAYNAGEHAVERHHGIPPYRETRHYVRKILGQYRRNRHPVPPRNRFGLS